MPVSRHRVPLVSLPGVLARLDHLLPRVRPGVGRQQIGFTARLQATATLPGGGSVDPGGRARWDHVVAKIGVGASPPVPIQVRGGVVVTGVVAAGAVAQGLRRRMGQHPGQAEAEVGEDVRAQLRVPFFRSILRVVEDRLDGALSEAKIAEWWLGFVAGVCGKKKGIV